MINTVKIKDDSAYPNCELEITQVDDKTIMMRIWNNSKQNTQAVVFKESSSRVFFLAMLSLFECAKHKHDFDDKG